MLLKRSWFIIAAWLLLLVPTLLIGAVALRLLHHEQERIEGIALAATTERAEAVVESIALAVAEVEEGLMDALRQMPAEGLAERLDRWRQENPLIRNAFIWEPQRGLVFPDAGLPGNDEEAGFIVRYQTLFARRSPWSPPKSDRKETAKTEALSSYDSRRELRNLTKPAPPVAAGIGTAEGSAVPPGESGWVPWFWEDHLFLLGWYEPAKGGPRYGVEVEMMALLARLVASLPSPAPAGEVYALLDGNGRIFHQTGAGQIESGSRRLVALSTSPALPHWQVAVFAPEGKPAVAGEGGLLLVGSLLVGTFVAAILFGGSLLLYQAYRNLRDARRKTSFVSNVSHELKTPLTTIRMYAELLAEERIRDELKRHRYLQVIVAESQRLTRLVNNVLDFSRLEQGRKKYSLVQVPLPELLHEILDAHVVRLQQAGILLSRQIPDKPRIAVLDRDAFEQVMLNLLDNALKYAGDSEELVVELRPEKGRCRIRVMDRGPGVPAAHRKRIFEKFHRVDDSLTAPRPGSGLGLAIARQLLRDMGGELLYMPRDGGGACFEIDLPGKD